MRSITLLNSPTRASSAPLSPRPFVASSSLSARSVPPSRRRISRTNRKASDPGRRLGILVASAARDDGDEARATATTTPDPTAIRALLANAVSQEDYREAARLQALLELADPSIVLRRRLEEAVEGERYDEAASLKAELDALLPPPPPKFEPGPTSSDSTTRGIRVRVKSFFVAGQSAVGTYTFAYRIKITNEGEGDDGASEERRQTSDDGDGPRRRGKTYQLLSRTWHIVDGGDGTEDNPRRVERVRGPGVVGETPILGPGESFSYSSFAQLRTPAGSMRGSYTFVEVERGSGDEDGGGGEREAEGDGGDPRRRATAKNPRARAVGEEFEVEIAEFGLDERDASPPEPGTM